MQAGHMGGMGGMNVGAGAPIAMPQQQQQQMSMSEARLRGLFESLPDPQSRAIGLVLLDELLQEERTSRHIEVVYLREEVDRLTKQLQAVTGQQGGAEQNKGSAKASQQPQSQQQQHESSSAYLGGVPSTSWGMGMATQSQQGDVAGLGGQFGGLDFGGADDAMYTPWGAAAAISGALGPEAASAVLQQTGERDMGGFSSYSGMQMSGPGNGGGMQAVPMPTVSSSAAAEGGWDIDSSMSAANTTFGGGSIQQQQQGRSSAGIGSQSGGSVQASPLLGAIGDSLADQSPLGGSVNQPNPNPSPSLGALPPPAVQQAAPADPNKPPSFAQIAAEKAKAPQRHVENAKAAVRQTEAPRENKPRNVPSSTGPAASAAAKVAGAASGSGAPVVLRLRGLPYSATETQVGKFFAGHSFIPGSIRFGTTSDGRPSGEGFVSFNSLQDAHKAIRDKDRHHIGDRYVEIFLHSVGDSPSSSSQHPGGKASSASRSDSSGAGNARVRAVGAATSPSVSPGVEQTAVQMDSKGSVKSSGGSASSVSAASTAALASKQAIKGNKQGGSPSSLSGASIGKVKVANGQISTTNGVPTQDQLCQMAVDMGFPVEQSKDMLQKVLADGFSLVRAQQELIDRLLEAQERGSWVQVKSKSSARS